MKDKVVTIDWKPDKMAKRPIYQQIIEYVSGKVGQGHWTVGSRLPSQRQLAQLFQVNRSTIVTAMEELISYGILKSDFGSGTRVASNTWSLLMSSPPDWNKYIQAGNFQENHPTIQTINKLEFDQRYVRLGTGELAPDLFPRELIAESLEQLPQKIRSLNYLGPLGLDELRETLRDHLEKKGIKAQVSNILITSGSLQALQLISVSMLRPGSVVFTEEPTYLKSLQIFQSAGMKLSGIPMDQEGMEYWNIKRGGDSLVYTIPSHQNPTGKVMSGQRREELLEYCERQRLPVIEDDAYGELWMEEEPPKPLKSMDEHGNVLYLGTISKTLAPGLRIGWVVGPEAVVERMGDIKMQVDYGASSVSQWMASELLKSPRYDTYLFQLRKKLKTRRDHMLWALERHFKDLAVWEKPSGGFYIWCKMKRPVNMDKVFQRAKKEFLLLNPGNIYGFEENYALRLSYAYASLEEIAGGVEALAGMIRQEI